MTDGDTVRWAAKIAQADTFIGEKPDGYDSEIAQGGTNVSGGQRQRLAHRAGHRQAAGNLYI